MVNYSAGERDPVAPSIIPYELYYGDRYKHIGSYVITLCSGYTISIGFNGNARQRRLMVRRWKKKLGIR